VKPSLTGIILDELADFLQERGAASYRAKQITGWIYKKRGASFDIDGQTARVDMGGST
jgi:adenine C2-methylase RlmN of 23S rRNA A2503 and tRNA A37